MNDGYEWHIFGEIKVNHNLTFGNIKNLLVISKNKYGSNVLEKHIESDIKSQIKSFLNDICNNNANILYQLLNDSFFCPNIW